MVSCSFCKKSYHEHKGLVLFTNEGRTVNYCSSKCRRNDDLGRDSKKVNWVKRDKKIKVNGKKGLGSSKNDNEKKSSSNDEKFSDKKEINKSDSVRDTKKVEEKVEKFDKKIEKKEEKKEKDEKSGKTGEK